MRHLDEGEIHAWLDGALAPDEAARIEAHAATCAQCSAEVATARGLIAGASRILLALDGVPGGVIPARTAADMAADASSNAPHAESVVSDLAYQRSKAAQRRHVPWFSRPLTRVAAGLVLAAGIGAVAIRDGVDPARQLTVELNTEPAGPIPLDTAAADLSGISPATAAADRVGEMSGQPVAVPAPQPDTFSRDASSRALARIPPPSRQLAREEIATQAASAVRTPVPTAPPGAAGNLSALAQEQRRVAEAPPPAPPVPAVATATPAAKAAGAVVGGGAGGSAQVASADSLRLDRMRRLEQSGLRLQNVVVTGAAASPQGQLGFAAARADTLAGACFALDLDAPAEVARGDMPLPRTMRIRLADLQNIATDPVRAETRDAGLQDAMRRAAGRAAPVPAGTLGNLAEPIETVEWEAARADSVVARRLAGIDVIVLRLAVAGGQVTGTAAAQTQTAPPVRVTGRRIACDGSV